MKYLLLSMALLTLLCSCTINNSGYDTWTLQSSKYYYPDESVKLNLKNPPLFTLKYPSTFMEFHRNGDLLPPSQVLFLRKLNGKISLDKLNNMSKDEIDEVYDDFLRWYLAALEIVILPPGGNITSPRTFPNSAMISPDEINQIIEGNTVVIDNILANKTIIRYHSLDIGADKNRVFIKSMFNYNGFDWYLFMDSPQEKEEIMTEYYNHLLNSFKIQR
jgi:hypothetical protein